MKHRVPSAFARGPSRATPRPAPPRSDTHRRRGPIPTRNGSKAVLLVSVVTTAGMALGHSPVTAQERVPASLTLDAAIEIASRHNPTYLQSTNDERVADWDVRSAYASLLPSMSASSGLSWQGGGEQQFGSLTLGDLGFTDQPSYYFSSYGLNLGLSFSLGALKVPGQVKANRRATVARGRAAHVNLTSQVSSAYIDALRQQEGLRLAEQQLANAQLNLDLAEGQLEVGTVTAIDVGSAEIQVGRSEVAVLQANNAVTTARRRLLQQLGLSGEPEFELGTSFALTEPTWDLDALVQAALSENPSLAASRASREAAAAGVSIAYSAYLPSLSISTGWSGFTRQASSVDGQVAQAMASARGQAAQCEVLNDLYRRLADPLPSSDCSIFGFTDAQRRAIEDANDQFPFSFQGSPPSVSLGISIPIFQGFGRARNIEAARVAQEDLGHQVRESEIALEADVSIALANVRTAHQSAWLEERNRDLAERQLELARERYQLGAITFVELTDAQTVFAQADRDRVIALFAYHDSVTSLEAFVGRRLR